MVDTYQQADNDARSVSRMATLYAISLRFVEQDRARRSNPVTVPIAAMIRKRQKEFCHRVHRVKWEHAIAAANTRKKTCYRMAADFDQERADAHASVAYLRAALRRLAGINPRDGTMGFRATRSFPRISDMAPHGSGGKVGLRSCNEAHWDAAVRAWEEDR